MSSPRDAHFLHAQRALEPVLAAPIEAPRAMTWVPRREELLVASASGAVTCVEPSFGSRVLWTGVPDPSSLDASAELVAVLGTTGTLEVWNRATRQRERLLETGLHGDAEVHLVGDRVLVIGDGRGGRRVRVYAGDTLEMDASVPSGTAAGEADGIRVARSLVTGVVTVPLGYPLPEEPATGHSIRFVGPRLLGVAVGGATVWENGSPLSFRLLDTSAAALTVDGQFVALGTFGGLVAICGVGAAPKDRAHPPRVSAHEGVVRALAFSDRGRWLATVGENCRIWAY